MTNWYLFCTTTSNQAENT